MPSISYQVLGSLHNSFCFSYCNTQSHLGEQEQNEKQPGQPHSILPTFLPISYHFFFYLNISHSTEMMYESTNSSSVTFYWTNNQLPSHLLWNSNCKSSFILLQGIIYFPRKSPDQLKSWNSYPACTVWAAEDILLLWLLLKENSSIRKLKQHYSCNVRLTCCG